MVRFSATIKRFASQGEKTGWTYIDVPSEIAEKLQPGNKKGFRVKGKLDDFSFSMISLLPMGGGDFIMTLNASIRKGIKKQKGAIIKVVMEADHGELKPPEELIECLTDSPEAKIHYDLLIQSHRNYYTNWINSAKTEMTRAKRIAATITALERKWDFGQMVRAQKKDKND